MYKISSIRGVNNHDGASTNVAFILALFATFLFAMISCQWTFVLTTSSDPLQYVYPALRPQDSFPFLDRIALWFWIRVVALLPIPLEMVGGISTLIITSSTMFIATWWLAKRIQPIAGAIFGGLYMASPLVLGISTYTYPMQLMTLVILVTIVLMDFSNEKWRYFVGGLGWGIACLCKIQGFAFLGFFIYDIFICKNRRFNKLVIASCGFVLSILTIIAIVQVVDGAEQINTIFTTFFLGGFGEKQFNGRGQGSIPPFYKFLLEPTCILAFVGMFWTWVNSRLSRLRPFSVVAAVQTISLILIYVITQRGGDLIYNYSFDALVFGLVAFSGTLVEDFKETGNHTYHYQLLVGILLLTGVYLLIETLAYFSQAPVHVYSPGQLFSTEITWLTKIFESGNAGSLGFMSYLNILATLATWSGICIFVCLLGRIPTLKRRRPIVIAGFILLVLGVGVRAGEGIKDGKFRKEWSKPYHKIGRQIEQFQLTPTWVSVKVNRGSISDGSYRAKRIYNAFYSDRAKGLQSKVKVKFGETEPLSFRFIITDQIDLITKYFHLETEDMLVGIKNGKFFALVDITNHSLELFSSGKSSQ